MTQNGHQSTSDTCTNDPANLAVVTTHESVIVEARPERSVLHTNNDELLTATTHDRQLGGVIGDLDAKSVSEA